MSTSSSSGASTREGADRPNTSSSSSSSAAPNRAEIVLEVPLPAGVGDAQAGQEGVNAVAAAGASEIQRGTNFSDQEITVMVRAYVAASEDPVRSTNRSGPQFWLDVREQMHNFVDDENLPRFPNRTPTSIESKCKKVMKAIGHFHACYIFAGDNLPSGSTEEDKRRFAHEEYTRRHNHDFKYDQAWLVMKSTPRWSFQQPLMHRLAGEQEQQGQAAPAPDAQEDEGRNRRPRGRDAANRNKDLASAVSHAGDTVAEALGGVREAMAARTTVAQTQVAAIQEQNRILGNQLAIVEQNTREIARQNNLLNETRKRKERVSALRLLKEWVTSSDDELEQIVRVKVRKSIKSILQSSLFESSDDSDTENRRAN